MIFRLCAAAAFAGLAFAATMPAAKADVARRCDWRGCTYIVCHWNGNRCHRYDRYGYDDDYRRYDGGYRGDDRDRYYGGNAYYRHRDWDHNWDRDWDSNWHRDWDRGWDRGWHYDCDRDADDCHVRRSWDGY